MLWWHWLLLGLALMVGEIATPGGFYLIFFGIAAVVIGLLAGLGTAGPLWLQIFGFSLLSVLLLVLFRKRLLGTLQPDSKGRPIDQLVGEVGVAEEYLAPGQVGRVELRGAAWSARNLGVIALTRGTRVRVIAVDGLMLHVEPEGAQI
ncbi:MAG: NfeD family protein [Acidobacteria bacterium]|nr:NfeD family protein [Acidobacteriota bacterium]